MLDIGPSKLRKPKWFRNQTVESERASIEVAEGMKKSNLDGIFLNGFLLGRVRRLCKCSVVGSGSLVYGARNVLDNEEIIVGDNDLSRLDGFPYLALPYRVDVEAYLRAIKFTIFSLLT